MSVRFTLVVLFALIGGACGSDAKPFEEVRRISFDSSYDVVVVANGDSEGGKPVLLICPAVKAEQPDPKACASLVVAEWDRSTSVNAALYYDGLTTLLTVAPPGSSVDVVRPDALIEEQVVEVVLSDAIAETGDPLRIQVKIATSAVDIPSATVCLTRPNGDRSTLLIARDDSELPESDDDSKFDPNCINQ